MITIDIPADLNAEDETGFVWTFLDEAAEADAIRPGAIVVAGSELTPAVCEVVDLVEKAVGTVVHLRVLLGSIGQYRRLLGAYRGLTGLGSLSLGGPGFASSGNNELSSTARLLVDREARQAVGASSCLERCRCRRPTISSC